MNFYNAEQKIGYIDAFRNYFHTEKERKQRCVQLLWYAGGEIYNRIGLPLKALPYYEEDLKIARKLSEESPTASNQRDLSVSLYKLGNLYLQLGHYQSAVDILQEAVDGLDMVRMQSQYMVREEEIQIVESALHLAQDCVEADSRREELLKKLVLMDETTFATFLEEFSQAESMVLGHILDALEGE